jgi:hypothetical protein
MQGPSGLSSWQVEIQYYITEQANQVVIPKTTNIVWQTTRSAIPMEGYNDEISDNSLRSEHPLFYQTILKQTQQANLPKRYTAQPTTFEYAQW